MKKLSILFTVVLSLSAFADTSKSCMNVELGHYGKNHWKDSFGNGLRGELVNQIEKQDDLFEKLEPEVAFELLPDINLDFEAKFSREINDHLPVPSDYKIAEDDFFSHQVRSKLNIELSSSYSIGDVFGLSPVSIFASGSAGINLIHATNDYVGVNKKGCELFSYILDMKTKKGRDFYKANCVERDKSAFSRYYEKVVDFFSLGLGKLLNMISDQQKNKKFAEDPLSALKLHSKLGVPLDHEIFFESNTEIAIGDIIEHTTFYGLTPIGGEVDIVKFFKPSKSKYRRLFRTLSFKKMLGNKVVIEVEDTIVKGNTANIFKIDPKFLGLIKVRFGKWSFDDFIRESLVQRFEVDILDQEGLKFFKHVLKSAYKTSWSLHSNSIVIDHSPYGQAVKAAKPIYQDGIGEDNKFVLKIPGIFEFEKRKYENIDSIKLDGDTYSIGDSYIKKERKNRLGLDLKLFQIKKIDDEFECQLNVATSYKNVVADTAMNIQCFFKDKYGEQEEADSIAEYLDMITGGTMKADHKKKLNALKREKPQKMNMFSNLSFSRKEIDRILNHTNDEIYATLSKLIFGMTAENVFAEKNHEKWENAKPYVFMNSNKRRAKKRDNDTYRNCSSMLAKVGITTKEDPMYNNIDGLAGRGKGLQTSSIIRCYQTYELAKEITQEIGNIRSEVKSSDKINRLLGFFTEAEKLGITQALMVQLAGGLGSNKVRYMYIVTVDELNEILASSNGNKYEVITPITRKTLKNEIEPVYFPRLTDIKFEVNTCQTNILMATFKLRYPVEDRSKITARFSLKDYSIVSDDSLKTIKMPLDHMVRNANGEFVARIDLGDMSILPDESYNMYFDLENKDEVKLSKEAKIYLKKINSVLSTGSVNRIKDTVEGLISL